MKPARVGKSPRKAARRAPEPGDILYLNADLDLNARVDVAPLVKFLKSPGVRLLRDFSLAVNARGEFFGVFETVEDFDEPEPNIRALLDVIEAMKPPVRRLWRKCTLREINIGYDCGKKPWAFNNGLAAETLRRIAKAGISLRITIYPMTPPKQVKKRKWQKEAGAVPPPL